MAAKSSARARSKSGKPSSASADGGSLSSGLTSLVSAGLTKTFEAFKDKVANTVSSNSDEYLSEAVDKITETTHQVVTWCKKNPIKMAVGIAALTAVSAFLVHTMGGPSAVMAKAGKTARKAGAMVKSLKANA